MLWAQLLPATLLFSLVCAENEFFIKNHILFRNLREVSTSKSHWKVAFVIDLDVFPKCLEELQSEARKISVIVEKGIDHYSKHKIAHVSPLIRTLRDVSQYLSTFESLHAEIYEKYFSLTEFLHIRTRRSLLPLGGVFKFLFGTADDRDIAGIRANVARLADSQKQVLHVLGHGLTILNATRVELSQNRDTINNMLSSLSDLKTAVERQVNCFERQILQLSSFHELINLVHTLTADVRHLYGKGRMYLTDFKIKLNLLSFQKLAPSIISPLHFKRLLKEIRAQLPRGYTYLLQPDRSLWKFYNALPCSTVISDNYLSLLVTIPLKPISNSFSLIRAEPLPIPYDNLTAPVKLTSDSVRLNAILGGGVRHFLINNKRSHYVYLREITAQRCLNQGLPFCEVEQGLTSTYNAKDCVIGSFLGEPKVTGSYCNTLVQSSKFLPVAKLLKRNQWVIVCDAPVHFTIQCLNGTQREVLVKTPVSKIILPPKCEAFSSHLNLPMFFEHDHTVTQMDSFNQELVSVTNVSVSNIWQPFHNKFVNLSHVRIPPVLQDIEGVPLDKLIKEVQFLGSESFPVSGSVSFLRSYWKFGVGLVLLILAVGLVFVLGYKGVLKRCANKVVGRRQKPGMSVAEMEFNQAGEDQRELRNLDNRQTSVLYRLLAGQNSSTPTAPDMQKSYPFLPDTTPMNTTQA